MEYLIIIVVAVAAALLDDRLGRKKKVPPPTLPQEIPRPKKRAKTPQKGDFEIPPMRNVPPGAMPDAAAQILREQEELRAQWEAAHREEQRQKERRAREERERAAAQVMQAPAPAAHAPQHAAAFLPPLTAGRMQQAIVLLEILGKPRALRRFPQR